jgi:anti-sigma-K factor RskA
MLGNELLENGGDQEDLDATAAKILELLDALKKALGEAGETEYVEVPVEKEVIVEKEVVVEKEVEKIVEVQNNLWLVLFIITAVLLVAAVAVLVVLFVKKKNTEKDMMSAPGNIED